MAEAFITRRTFGKPPGELKYASGWGGGLYVINNLDFTPIYVWVEFEYFDYFDIDGYWNEWGGNGYIVKSVLDSSYYRVFSDGWYNDFGSMSYSTTDTAAPVFDYPQLTLTVNGFEFSGSPQSSLMNNVGGIWYAVGYEE